MSDVEITDRLAALELLVEQLIVERCAIADDPLGTAELARDRLAEMAATDTSGRVTRSVASALVETMGRVVRRIERMRVGA